MLGDVLYKEGVGCGLSLLLLQFVVLYKDNVYFLITSNFDNKLC